jgi:hypothetical protein
MKPGDLVELAQPTLTWEGWIEVGSMDNSGPSDRRRGYWPAGTLAVFIDSLPNVYHQLVSVVLIDGSPGWVWNDEIRPVTTHSGGDQ